MLRRFPGFGVDFRWTAEALSFVDSDAQCPVSPHRVRIERDEVSRAALAFRCSATSRRPVPDHRIHGPLVLPTRSLVAAPAVAPAVFCDVRFGTLTLIGNTYRFGRRSLRQGPC